MGLFGRRLRLSGLLEHQSGHIRRDLFETTLCRMGQCRAAVEATTPLSEQAEVAVIRTQTDYFLTEPADFTRLRELSATIDLPSGLARAVRARSLALTVAGRNLAVWTDVTGVDPETNDLMALPKSWMVRLDLGL